MQSIKAEAPEAVEFSATYVYKYKIMTLSAIFSGQQISTEMGPKIFFLQMVLDDVLSNNMKCDEIFRSSNLFESLKIPNI